MMQEQFQEVVCWSAKAGASAAALTALDKVYRAVVETPLALLQVQVESLDRHVVDLL